MKSIAQGRTCFKPISRTFTHAKITGDEKKRPKAASGLNDHLKLAAFLFCVNFVRKPQKKFLFELYQNYFQCK